MIVAITGGTGFLGRRVVAELVRRGVATRVLARDPSSPRVPRGAGVDLVPGRLEDPASLARLTGGATHVIHSAALLGSIDAAELRRVNVDGTRAVLRAATAANIERFVHVSSVAAEWRADAVYGGSKKAAEDVVEGGTVPWVMLRPPVILGPGSQVEAKVARFARLRVVPTIAGSGRMYPVHVDDVALACVEALTRPGVCGGRYELPGPEALTLADIQRRTLASVRRRALVLAFPVRPLKLASRGLATLFGRTPLSADVIDAIRRGVEMDAGPARRDLGFDPRPV